MYYDRPPVDFGPCTVLNAYRLGYFKYLIFSIVVHVTKS